MKSRLSIPLLSLGVGFCLAFGGPTDDLTDKMGEKNSEEIAEKRMERAAGGDVEVNDNGTVSIELEGVKFVLGASQKVPDGFPLPPPESAKVTTISQFDLGNEQCVGLSVEFGEGGAAAVEEIQRLGVADGWTINTSPDTDINGMKIVMFSAKKDGQTVSVSMQIIEDEAVASWLWRKPKAAAE